MSERLIELAAPRVEGQTVHFAWHVDPPSELYTRPEFDLTFPDAVDLRRIPPDLWWRIALLCLHAHWPLLRPCRVTLPVRLPEAEAEAWLRLTDAGVASLEAAADGHDTARSIELVGSGPVLAPLPALSDGDEGPVVSCFSGGRDSTAQLAMLSELGVSPVLVAVTSPGPWNNEHVTPRRRFVLSETARRRGLELLEVNSNLRGNWDNGFAAVRYGVGVNELTDTLLYLAAAIVVAAARGARLVMMASEAEVQENARREGMVVQMQHFMYSAVTHAVVSGVFGSAGIQVGSLTYPLAQFQVQRLLAERYSDLRDLQYSCWELSPEQAACSRCVECRGIALNLVAAGVSPSEAGIDMVELLHANHDWRPGTRYVTDGVSPHAHPRKTVGRGLEMQALRCLAHTPAQQVAELIDGRGSESERRRALEIYSGLREQALTFELEPEPGYLTGYLELVPESLREGTRAILDEHFAGAPLKAHAENLGRIRMLSDWITAPLRPGAVRDRVAGAAPASPRPGGEPIRLSEAELEPIRELIPAPEPTLGRTADGRVLRVAETILDGHELQYVTASVQDNWISSAGPFVKQFERAFADAMGTRFAIACSSGTAALHLAVAAAGIGPGDEVLVPAFTMIATANAVRYVGADPVLVDADPATWNLDPERLADKLTSRTRAIIAVHTYGQPADMDAIRRFARSNDLIVIEDAAEAHGAQHGGQPVGSLGAAAAFSLYGNKILTTGEGGVVTTDEERIASSARELRDHAFSSERHFWHRRVGFNYRMTNLQAAIGLAQLERMGELVTRRLDVAGQYLRLLSGVEGLALPPQLEGGVMWMFGVLAEPPFAVDRDELRRRLAAAGIETRTFFVPLHLQPVYRRSFAGQRYPVAERLGATGLYLPSSPSLSGDDVAYVANEIRSASIAATPARASSS